MKKIINRMACLTLCFLPAASLAWSWHWADLWKTKDQQGAQLLQSGHAEMAAKTFSNNEWRAVANYRSHDYTQAFQQFKVEKTSDGQYNAGNAAAALSHYEEAIAAYDKAIAMNSNNTDAIQNREIVKKLLKQKLSQNNSAKNNKDVNNKDGKNDKDSTQNTSDNNTKGQNNGKQKLADNKKWNSTESKDPVSQSDNAAQKPGDTKNLSTSAEKLNEKNATADANTEHFQPQNENQKQLLRRIADDPGGLLRQKFLRDYYRRHRMDENQDQGVN